LGKEKSMISIDSFFSPYFRNTLVVSIANVLTSIFAGFVIFAYLGYLSYITGQKIEDVVTEGKY
jgi:solute carrier family 6 amino acid transporter-like protein 5/7/9/14